VTSCSIKVWPFKSGRFINALCEMDIQKEFTPAYWGALVRKVTVYGRKDIIHTSAPYVNRVTRNKENIVNKTFLTMMEGLGYDVELHYVKREED